MSPRIDTARSSLVEAHAAARAASGAVAAARAALARADALRDELQAEHDRLAAAEHDEVSAGASGLVAALKAGLLQRPDAPSDATLKAKLARAEAEHRLAAITLARDGLQAEHLAAVETLERARTDVHKAAGHVVAAHCADLADEVKAAAARLAHLHAEMNGAGSLFMQGQGFETGDVFDAGEHARHAADLRPVAPLTNWTAYRERLCVDPEAMPDTTWPPPPPTPQTVIPMHPYAPRTEVGVMARLGLVS